jgi:hypothetical protein
VLRILQEHHFHPYKVQHAQGLHGDDADRRREFCEWKFRNGDSSIFFSDEAIFHLSGHVNRHNFRHWSDTNSNWIETTRVQVDPRVMMWAGIWEDQIIGPYFFSSNVTGETYLSVLRNYFWDFLDTVPLPRRNSMFFQQYGAPPHYASILRAYLNEQFHNKLIGRRGPVEWQPRSPDLTPLDFFLWDHLKSVVYRNRLRNINELKETITLELRNITWETLLRMKASFSERIQKCLQVGGGHCEHLS